MLAVARLAINVKFIAGSAGIETPDHNDARIQAGRIGVKGLKKTLGMRKKNRFRKGAAMRAR